MDEDNLEEINLTSGGGSSASSDLGAPIDDEVVSVDGEGQDEDDDAEVEGNVVEDEYAPYPLEMFEGPEGDEPMHGSQGGLDDSPAPQVEAVVQEPVNEDANDANLLQHPDEVEDWEDEDENSEDENEAWEAESAYSVAEAEDFPWIVDERSVAECKQGYIHAWGRYAFFKREFMAMRRRARDVEAENRALRAENRQMQTTNDQLEQRILALRGQKGRFTEITWPRVLEHYLEHGFWPRRPGPEELLPGQAMPPLIRKYEDLYKLSCREENICSHPEKTHPDLELREPTRAEERRLTLSNNNDAVESFGALDDNEVAGNNDLIQYSPSPVARVPPDVLAQILQNVLFFEGRVIHAISRLDPYREPDAIPTNSNGNPVLLHRFHVGSHSVNVTCAVHPQRLLAPLLVNRAWNFMGVNIFYGKNTFAFSSLGE
ncbi:Fc.00g040170.m01.CDS01 [Cosmosporella sp. VM-42]